MVRLPTLVSIIEEPMVKSLILILPETTGTEGIDQAYFPS